MYHGIFGLMYTVCHIYFMWVELGHSEYSVWRNVMLAESGTNHFPKLICITQETGTKIMWKASFVSMTMALMK